MIIRVSLKSLSLAILTIGCNYSWAQTEIHNVKIIGAMKNVMWNGELAGIIDLDTLSKKNLFGLGPVEYLSGEILIFEGKAYKSMVLADSTMHVEETYKIQAPFFAFANINEWTEVKWADSIRSIQQLEAFLEKQTQNIRRPFLFRFIGEIEWATIHVVNLPEGSIVRSPSDAHQGQKKFKLENTSVDILGFFSTQHKGIFTHHDTYVHMHLITSDRKKMGHVDDVRFKKGTLKIGQP